MRLRTSSGGGIVSPNLKRNPQLLPEMVISILFALTITLRMISSSKAEDSSEFALVREEARSEQLRACSLLSCVRPQGAPPRASLCMHTRPCDRLESGRVGPEGLAPSLVAAAA